MTKFKVGDRKYRAKQIGTRPYYISECGEVLSTVNGDPKILKGGNYGGYRGVVLTRGGLRENVRHHHLVMHWWVKPRPIGMVINHKNGIKKDNRLSNLEYCTPRQNVEHAMAHRLYHSGDRCSWSKLNAAQITVLKKSYEAGMSLKQLARAFEVNKKAVQQVLSKRSWKYV